MLNNVKLLFLYIIIFVHIIFVHYFYCSFCADFVTLGGVPVSLQLLQHPSESLRFWVLWVLGAAVQNNSKVQDALLQHGALDTIMQLIKNEPSQTVKEKALFAITGTPAPTHIPKSFRIDHGSPNAYRKRNTFK